MTLIVVALLTGGSLTYDRICSVWSGFFREIEKETAAGHFSFAELEELEEDLAKLTSRLRKIQHRDFFLGSKAEEAIRLFASCRQMLDLFTRTVYTCAGLEPLEE